MSGMGGKHAKPLIFSIKKIVINMIATLSNCSNNSIIPIPVNGQNLVFRVNRAAKPNIRCSSTTICKWVQKDLRHSLFFYENKGNKVSIQQLRQKKSTLHFILYKIQKTIIYISKQLFKIN